MVIEQKMFHIYDKSKIDDTGEGSQDVPLCLEDLFNMEVSVLEQ